MNRRDTVRCLWLVAKWSLAMVGMIVAVLAFGAAFFWTGLQITHAFDLDAFWSGPITAVIAMAIYGAGIGAFECRSKLKRGEL